MSHADLRRTTMLFGDMRYSCVNLFHISNQGFYSCTFLKKSWNLWLFQDFYNVFSLNRILMSTCLQILCEGKWNPEEKQSQLTYHCICHHARRCGRGEGHDRWCLRWQRDQNQDTRILFHIQISSSIPVHVNLDSVLTHSNTLRELNLYSKKTVIRFLWWLQRLMFFTVLITLQGNVACLKEKVQ